jgi:septin family protein
MTKTQKKFSVNIGVMVTKGMGEQFHKFAKEQGATASELLRGAIRRMLSGESRGKRDASRTDR